MSRMFARLALAAVLFSSLASFAQYSKFAGQNAPAAASVDLRLSEVRV